MEIADTSFIVVDTETTGRSYTLNRIIEVAAVKVVGGEIVDEFSQLINPGQLIPSRITQLTRISNGMVLGMPDAEQVMPHFLDFLSDGVFVAHNLTFDISFINAELSRLQHPPITNTALCTLRLARRLLRGLRSKGLSGLAAFYGIEVKGRHRALGDARATAEVLVHFLNQLATEKGITSCEELIRFQFTSYAPKKGTRRRVVQLRDEIVPEIPTAPGIYLFKGKSGKVIYVGKAKSLRSRVRSYFTSIEAHSNHIRRLVEKIHTIEWVSMDSELEALIEESRRIKSLRPRFNRAQKFYRNRPFVKLTVNETYPGVELTPYLVDDGADYFGPMGSKREAHLVLDLIKRFFLLRECGEGTFRQNKTCIYKDLNRCEAPCVNNISPEAYSAEVEKVKRFLMGEDGDEILALLRDEMSAASTAMDYEKAALFRDQYDMVTRLLARQECIAAPVLEHNAVVIDRSMKDEMCRLLVIQYGRLVETIVLTAHSDLAVDQLERTLHDRLHHYFPLSKDRPARYMRTEIEEIRLLAHWLFVHRDEISKIDFAFGMELSDLVCDIVSRLAIPEIGK